ERSAEQSEEATFDESLAEQPRARSAESGAHGHFAAASRAAREQKAGKIRARDEKNESRGAEKHEVHRADLLDFALEKILRSERVAFAEVGVVGDQAMRDGVELRFELVGGLPFAKFSDELEHEKRLIDLVFVAEDERRPRLLARIAETARPDANDRP